MGFLKKDFSVTLILLMKCLEKVIFMRECPKNYDFQGKISQKWQISRNIFLCILFFAKNYLCKNFLCLQRIFAWCPVYLISNHSECVVTLKPWAWCQAQIHDMKWISFTHHGLHFDIKKNQMSWPKMRKIFSGELYFFLTFAWKPEILINRWISDVKQNLFYST